MQKRFQLIIVDVDVDLDVDIHKTFIYTRWIEIQS